MTSPDDFGDDLSRRLAGLADDATSYTHSHLQPLPSESVRRLGTERRHRRFGGVAVATLACAIMAGGVAIGATRMQDSDGPPVVGTPAPSSSISSSASTDQPSTTPSSRVPSASSTGASGAASGGAWPTADADLLPLRTELAFQDFGDYRVVKTAQGQGTLPVQPCLQELGTLGAAGVARRDYRFSTSDQIKAWAWVLRFDTTEQAAQATTVLQSWGEACRKGDTHPVEVGQGTAVFYEHSSPRDGGTFNDYGITQVGGVVAVILSEYHGPDANWAMTAEDATGLPLHPWIRSLPLVNARIAGKTIEPSYQAKACTAAAVAADAAQVKGSAGAKAASYRLTVRNDMRVPCTLTGFPTVQIADDQGDPIGAGSEPDGEPGVTVTLEPGQSAVASIQIEPTSAHGDTCQPVMSSAFRMVLPGETEPTYTYTEGLIGCATTSIVLLRVTAFEAE